jgi:hypothetical protein
VLARVLDDPDVVMAHLARVLSGERHGPRANIAQRGRPG